MAPPVPGIEIADHRNAARVRRPHGKAHAGHAVDRIDGRADTLRQIPMRAFGEEMEIHVAEDWSEGIRVFGFLQRLWPFDPEQVIRAARERADEQAAMLDLLQTAEPFAAVAGEHI